MNKIKVRRSSYNSNSQNTAEINNTNSANNIHTFKNQPTMLIKDQETSGHQISEEVTGYVSERLQFVQQNLN